MIKHPWRILAVSAAFVIVVFGLSLWLLTRDQQLRLNTALRDDLLAQSRYVRAVLREHWTDLGSDVVSDVLRTTQAYGVDVAVLGVDGTILLDSRVASEDEPLSGAEEIGHALSHGWSTAERQLGSPPSGYVISTLRVGTAAQPLGVVWLARPVWTLTSDAQALVQLIGSLVAAAALMTLMLGLVLLRVRQRLLRRVVEGASRLSVGDLHADLDIAGSDELAVLSSALNSLRRRLVTQLDTIEQQRAMLERLINQLYEGVVVVRGDGRIVMLNPAAARLLDIETGGDGISGLLGQPAEDCIPQEPLRRLLLGPHEVPKADEEESEARTSAGQQVPIVLEQTERTVHLLASAADMRLAPVDHPPAEQTGRVLVLTDVTELHRTIQLRTDFVANASHELRTPLATIRAAVETLLSMDLAAKPDAARNFLGVINRHSVRLERMVSDLLDLSRLESSTQRYQPEVIPVGKLLDDLYGRFAEALERKELLWDARPETGGPTTVVVCLRLLWLALDNLVENAIKFTDKGGRISVRIGHDGEGMRFAVSDTGCGIASADQERVFERFFQVERGRGGGERGTGLGLSIVRHAVGAMRGKVKLDSAVGKGTSVSFTIPQPTGGAHHASD
ncbi:MAG: HAMP domain-containing protein [Phycisphaerae bacterium]|nr:HAMP domain-containing protein [Phycisphaerae bacterium]